MWSGWSMVLICIRLIGNRNHNNTYRTEKINLEKTKEMRINFLHTEIMGELYLATLEFFQFS